MATGSTIEILPPAALRIGEALVENNGRGEIAISHINYLGYRRATRQVHGEPTRLTRDIVIGTATADEILKNLIFTPRHTFKGIPLDPSEQDFVDTKGRPQRLPTASSHMRRFRIDRAQRLLKNPVSQVRARIDSHFDYLGLRSCMHFLYPGKDVTIDDRRGREHDTLVAIGVGFRGPLAIALARNPDHWIDLTQARITFADKPAGATAPHRPTTVTVDCLQALAVN